MTMHATLLLALLVQPAPVPAGPAPAPAPASVSDERHLVLSPEHTHLGFLLKASTHDVHGTFALREGEIAFTPGGGPARGRLVMDATRASTGNARRDRKMHEKVLESGVHPVFVFTVDRLDGSVEGDGPHDVVLHGTIELHGAAHPIDVPARVDVAGDAITAKGTATIPYVAWGLDDPSVAFFRVEKTVEVTVELTGTVDG